jgi:hypothetical protein
VQGHPRVWEASHSTKRITAKQVARGDAGKPCGRLARAALARCMRPQVLAADRQLRRAYRHAVRQGVDREVLVAYRDEWSSLRRKANKDPHRVVAAYRRLAGQLDSARTRG